jgi:hypothetical protein
MRDLYPPRGGRHLFAALELGEDKLFGHIKPRKPRGGFLESCRYLHALYPPQVRIAIICGNFTLPDHQAGRPGRDLRQGARRGC